MRPYKVLITHEVLSLPRPSVQNRNRILSFLDGLCADPFQKGDYEERDETDGPAQANPDSSLRRLCLRSYSFQLLVQTLG